MKIITAWEGLETIKQQLTLIIGNFDGVHLGHQKLIETADNISKGSCQTALLTFDPHPMEFLKKETFLRLTPLEEMKERLRKYPLNYWLCLPFNSQVAGLEPEQFIERVNRHCNIANIVVGFNFKFGKNAAGTVEKLSELSVLYGFELRVIPAVYLEDTGNTISSTYIRKQLQLGKVELANKALGQPYQLFGRVAHGKKRGRKMGFPTANLIVNKSKFIPADGVYAGVVNNVYNAAVSIGNNPSFNNNQRTIEIYILDYSGEEIYGEEISLQLRYFLRELIKFDDKEMLIEQIKTDIKKIQQLNPLG